MWIQADHFSLKKYLAGTVPEPYHIPGSPRRHINSFFIQTERVYSLTCGYEYL